MGVPESQRVTRPTQPDALVLEAWGQGLLVGALLVMFAITIANMRKRVLLHKLILAEVSIHNPQEKRFKVQNTDKYDSSSWPCFTEPGSSHTSPYTDGICP
jgi:hypothetical protein